MDISAALTTAGTQANLALTASALVGVALVGFGLRKVLRMMGG